jgi:DNA helicase HerA-like ATPase
MSERPFAIGGCRPLDGAGETLAIELPPDHFTTHGCVVGMTGSGKTGLLMVLVEEALRSRIPVLMVDVKGDLPNLLLTFPGLAPEAYPDFRTAAIAPAVRSTPVRKNRA